MKLSIALAILLAWGTPGAFAQRGKIRRNLGSRSGSSDDSSEEAAVGSTGSPTLDMILDQGVLNCGIGAGAGFAVNTGRRQYEGMDADLCRAVAAAILGDSDKTRFRFVTSAERFTFLSNGRVDVVPSTTITMERDVYQGTAGEGFSFTVPYFYDGLGFSGIPPYGTCADNVDVSGACADLRLCVPLGTSWLPVVYDLFPEANVVVAGSIPEMYERLIDGTCNAISGETAFRVQEAVEEGGYTGDFEIGSNLFSKEPLGIMTADGDPLFSDFVGWVIQALFYAEEAGISQATAASIGTTTVFGDYFQNMFIDAIAAVGNYGEIYTRNLQAIVPRGGRNVINTGQGGGLIYANPFGSLDVAGSMGDMLETIHARGEVRCGITRTAGFGEFDYGDTWRWTGFDVDFCRAVSAAIFNGDPTRVLFVVLSSDIRFTALSSGQVDLLSRVTTHTLMRDVMEPSSGVGFSFTSPTVYDGLSFGGVPEFVTCADNLDVTGSCAALRVCVEGATTTYATVSTLFPADNIVETDTLDALYTSLSDGTCNVIAGEAAGIAPTTVVAGGYTGSYAVATNTFSKEPLALVTRQGDANWSAFCQWVVMATFYAEEQGITAATATSMPTTNLFGALLSSMLIDAIRAVGNYGEIYARSLEAVKPRAGLNTLNSGGPSLYPLPGI